MRFDEARQRGPAPGGHLQRLRDFVRRADATGGDPQAGPHEAPLHPAGHRDTGQVAQQRLRHGDVVQDVGLRGLRKGQRRAHGALQSG